MRRAHRFVVVFLAVAICATFGTATATVAVRRTASAPAAVPLPVRQGVATLSAVPAAATERLFAVATFARSGPTAARRDALARLGLDVLPLRHLPLALVSGTKAEDRKSVV